MCDIFKLEKHIQEQGFRGIKKGDIALEQSHYLHLKKLVGLNFFKSILSILSLFLQFSS